MEGYTYYSAKEGPELGWFGKNAGHMRSVYRFYWDSFASFDATTQGTDQPLLAEETIYLFGKGQPESPKNLAYGETTTNWEGQRVRVKFPAGHNECRPIVSSKLAIAQKAAVEAAQKEAEAAALAAKLRADNAPTTHQGGLVKHQRPSIHEAPLSRKSGASWVPYRAEMPLSRPLILGKWGISFGLLTVSAGMTLLTLPFLRISWISR